MNTKRIVDIINELNQELDHSEDTTLEDAQLLDCVCDKFHEVSEKIDAIVEKHLS